jgi:hypothetical protein
VGFETSHPDDAVSCEPVSAPNSLLTGKLTGNFRRIGPSAAIFSCLINARIQRLYSRIPYATEQGIFRDASGNFFEETGNLIEQAAELRSNAMLRVVAPSQSARKVSALPAIAAELMRRNQLTRSATSDRFMHCRKTLSSFDYLSLRQP